MERSPPESSLYNILDFLTFFYNGTTDPATHNFIQSRVLSIAPVNSQLACRYKDFYTLTAYLVANQDWNVGSLEDLLEDFVDLETKYKLSLKSKNAMMSRAWQSLKMKIVNQIGIATLRELLGLQGPLAERAEDFVVPNGFPFEAYEKQIDHLFRTHRRHYQEEEDASELRQEYYAHVDNLTVEIITTLPAKKSARGKGGAAARPKKVLDESMLYQILEDQSDEKLIAGVLKFVRSVEEKVLPIPLDVGQYPPLDEGIHALLRGLSASKPPAATAGLSASKPPAPAALSASKSASKIPVLPGSSLAPAAAVVSATKPAPASSNGSAARLASPKPSHQKPTEVEHGTHRGPVPLEADWGDDQADTQGPYYFDTSPYLNRGGRPKKSPAAVPKSPEVPNSPPAQRMSAVKLASPLAQRMSAIKASAPAARPGRHAPAPAAAHDNDGTLAAAADRLKRKYAETDPLNEFLGGNDTEDGDEEWEEERPAVKARVSREPLLSAKPPAAPRAQTRTEKNQAQAPQFQASARGDKIDFGTSDSDELQDTEDENGAGKSGIQMLLDLKQNGEPKAASFPARLQSPSASRRASTGSAPVHGSGSKKVNKTAQVRVRWTFEEECALESGVARYGEGGWAMIRDDPEYHQVFQNRTNVNLKDKWRNMLKLRAL